MSGVATLREMGGASGGGAIGAASWSNIGPTPPGVVTGWTNTVSLSVSGTASLSASLSGGATLEYALAGVAHGYTGPFTVTNGQTLAWGALNETDSTIAGTVTVSQGGTTLASFTYVVRGFGGGDE